MAGQLSSAGSRQRLLLLNIFGVLGAVQLLSKIGLARRLCIRLMILGVRMGTPLACLLVFRNAVAVLRTPRALNLRRLMWYSISVWSVAEVAFLVYILEYWRQLDGQTTTRWKAVLTHSTEEKRRASMERYLTMMTQVCRGGDTEPSSPTVRTKNKVVGLRSKTDSDHGLLSLGNSLMRYEGSPKRGLLGAGQIFSSGNLLGLQSSKREASVDDLIKLWESSTGSLSTARDPSEEVVSEQEMRRLYLIELTNWFQGPDKDGQAEHPEKWLRRGNVEDWIAHYWFRGTTAEEIRNKPKTYKELQDLVNMVLQFMGLQELREGRNPRMKPVRLMSDPLPVIHRPLLVYVGTSLLCPLMSLQVMHFLGFRRERVGGLTYWHRRADKRVKSDVDLAGPRQTPMVFCHGLGVGLVPYYLFIARLARRYSGDLYVPELPFLAMQPWECIPSAREVVAQIQDMLAANRHHSAHFFGHSFGSIIIGWMLKMSPSSVLYTTLMEPAMFLMMKSDVLTKILVHPPKTCMEQCLRYFVFRELFTVNLLCRNTFWEQNTVWPEDLFTPTIVQLAGNDALVHSLFVRRLLEHERRERKLRGATKQKRYRRPSMLSAGSSVDVASQDAQGTARVPENQETIEIQWCEGFFHGQILGSRRQTEKLFSRMRQMVQASESKDVRG